MKKVNFQIQVLLWKLKPGGNSTPRGGKAEKGRLMEIEQVSSNDRKLRNRVVQTALERLEPYVWKLTCTVLRGCVNW
ncbi:hypothetical protein [Desulfonema limicola]|uniref:hypothetical protein n=1 Tax=Desulfonema limicola TaxID=45656 RepID=UPI001A9B9EEC|nr:hypothetical protein [Desulfonema limicola]